MTFEDWWPTAFSFCFGTKWFERAVKVFAKKAYNAGKHYAKQQVVNQPNEGKAS